MRAADQGTFQASTDPLMQAAARLLPAALREEDADKQLAGELLRLRPSSMKGLIGSRESQGRAVYPDANSTLRVAFGTLLDLHPRDAVRSQRLQPLARNADINTPAYAFHAP